LPRKCAFVNQSLPGYLTIEEAAEHYRATPGTLRYWRHIGRGPLAVKPGTTLLYPVEEIARHDAQLLAEAQQLAAERDPGSHPAPRLQVLTGTDGSPARPRNPGRRAARQT
jgi:hypothetical protein